jgi:anti-anti-sigma factor
MTRGPCRAVTTPTATECAVHGTDVPELPAERTFTVEAAGLRIVSITGPHSTSLALDGELDYATRPVFEQAVNRALRTGPPSLIIDLGRLDFLAVAGAHSFEETARRCREEGGRLVLLNPRRAVRRLLGLFEIAGLVGGQR